MDMSRNNTITRDNTDIFASMDNVYAGIKPSHLPYEAVDEEDAMLRSIQQKLGGISTTDVGQEETVNNPDLMPSETTMRLEFKRNYAQNAEYAATRGRLSTRQKVYIASYIAVVLALVLAVTLCGVAITGSFASVSGIEAEYADKSQQLNDLNELVNEDNYDALLDKATEMGFVQVDQSNSYQYTQLETRPAQNYNVQTNWFDQLCQWLSGVFGG